MNYPCKKYSVNLINLIQSITSFNIPDINELKIPSFKKRGYDVEHSGPPSARFDPVLSSAGPFQPSAWTAPPPLPPNSAPAGLSHQKAPQ